MPRRSPLAIAVRLFQVACLAIVITIGCTPAPAASTTKPYPTSVAQADEMKKGGASWTNQEIRVRYNQIVSTIAASNEQWKREGLSAEERARRAYQVRHDARVLSRAMMASRVEVELLEKRDQEKYGHPDGPTFDELVESAKKKGVAGDAIYEQIIESAQRTDAATNAAFGVK